MDESAKVKMSKIMVSPASANRDKDTNEDLLEPIDPAPSELKEKLLAFVG